MTMIITIDNRDLENVHIDTYGVLTGEGADDQQIEYLREEYKNDSLTYDDFNWSYDHGAIVRDFARVSINYLFNELITHGNGMITSITLESSGSPKYYNYTTDHYVAVYEYNTVKLHDYIAQNYDAVLEKVRTYDSVMSYTPVDDISKDDLAHAGLCHYIDNTIDREHYNMHMWEHETEVYYENTTVTLAQK